jgi:hypothetical protein
MNYGRCFSSLYPRILSIAMPFHVPSHFSSCPFWTNSTLLAQHISYIERDVSASIVITWLCSLLRQCLRYARAVSPMLEESHSRTSFACSSTVTLCHAANGGRRCKTEWRYNPFWEFSVRTAKSVLALHSVIGRISVAIRQFVHTGSAIPR